MSSHRRAWLWRCACVLLVSNPRVVRARESQVQSRVARANTRMPCLSQTRSGQKRRFRRIEGSVSGDQMYRAANGSWISHESGHEPALANCLAQDRMRFARNVSTGQHCDVAQLSAEITSASYLWEFEAKAQRVASCCRLTITLEVPSSP